MPPSPLSSLLPHPSTPAGRSAAPRVALSRSADGALTLRYELTGGPAGLRVPAARPPGRGDGLWRHTCCEAFVGAAGTAAYREFNFSPSGEWQAYAFAAYRAGGLLEPAAAPDIATESHADRLVLVARIPPRNLPAGPVLRIGLCAVLEDLDGGLSYWALRHAPGKPDFHHPDTFALEIDLRETHP